MFNLQSKITIKGLLMRQGVHPAELVKATAKDLCYWWGRCYVCPITEFAKIPPVISKKWR